MTYEEREAIFAKEVLDLDDVMKLAVAAPLIKSSDFNI